MSILIQSKKAYYSKALNLHLNPLSFDILDSKLRALISEEALPPDVPLDEVRLQLNLENLFNLRLQILLFFKFSFSSLKFPCYALLLSPQRLLTLLEEQIRVPANAIFMKLRHVHEQVLADIFSEFRPQNQPLCQKLYREHLLENVQALDQFIRPHCSEISALEQDSVLFLKFYVENCFFLLHDAGVITRMILEVLRSNVALTEEQILQGDAAFKRELCQIISSISPEVEASLKSHIRDACGKIYDQEKEECLQEFNKDFTINIDSIDGRTIQSIYSSRVTQFADTLQAALFEEWKEVHIFEHWAFKEVMELTVKNFQKTVESLFAHRLEMFSFPPSLLVKKTHFISLLDIDQKCALIQKLTLYRLEVENPDFFELLLDPFYAEEFLKEILEMNLNEKTYEALQCIYEALKSKDYKCMDEYLASFNLVCVGEVLGSGGWDLFLELFQLFLKRPALTVGCKYSLLRRRFIAFFSKENPLISSMVYRKMLLEAERGLWEKNDVALEDKEEAVFFTKVQEIDVSQKLQLLRLVECESVNCMLAVAGFLSEDSSMEKLWASLLHQSNIRTYALNWAAENFESLTTHISRNALRHCLSSDDAIPLTRTEKLITASSVVKLLVSSNKSNPYIKAQSNAIKAGVGLARLVSEHSLFANKHLTLISYSLGTKLATHFLLNLKDSVASVMINDVVLLASAMEINFFEAALPALIGSKSIIGGKLCVIYTPKDVALKYAFRVRHGGHEALGSKGLSPKRVAAILHREDETLKKLPLEMVERYVNLRYVCLDVSSYVENHNRYLSHLEKILQELEL